MTGVSFEKFGFNCGICVGFSNIFIYLLTNKYNFIKYL